MTAPVREPPPAEPRYRAWLALRDPAGRRMAVAVLALATCFIASTSHLVLRELPGYVALLRALTPEGRYLVQLVRWGLILSAALLVVFKGPPSRYLDELGLLPGMRTAARGVGFAFLCSLPMLVIPLATGGCFRADISPWSIVAGALLAPLAEEVVYRGYCFGQLWRRGGVPMWPAAIVTGAIFGLLHLGPDTKTMGTAQVVLHLSLIAAGGVAYAYVLSMWRFNLWVPIGLHLFMNLWWTVLTMGDTPLSGTLTIASRIAVVAAAITWSILMSRGRVADWR